MERSLVRIDVERSAGSLKEVAGVEDLEEELVALVAILAKKGSEVLHGGSLNGLVTITTEDAPNGVENVIAPSHLDGAEISRALGYAGFYDIHLEKGKMSVLIDRLGSGRASNGYTLKRKCIMSPSCTS